jgi:hypothetical protein
MSSIVCSTIDPILSACLKFKGDVNLLMTHTFGNLFAYQEYVMHKSTIVFHSCTMVESATYYTHIELDPEDGTLTYYKNGVHSGKRWISQ